jgi:hypothetical protein
MPGKRERKPVVYSQPPLAQMTQWHIQIYIDQTKVTHKKFGENQGLWL